MRKIRTYKSISWLAPKISRREFLSSAAACAASLALGRCSSGGGSASRSVVSITRAESYTPALVRQQLQTALEGIGGISDVIKHGRRVAVKVNLTGGSGSSLLSDSPQNEPYITHSSVAGALCELLRDAGATEIFIVEALYDEQSWSNFGYTEIAAQTGARLIDLNRTDPYPDYLAQQVNAPLVYDRFTFNRILEEVDAFISLAKMKCHTSCGITHSLKNLVGLVPQRLYTLNETDLYRTALHGAPGEEMYRLPGAIVDLSQARPIDLSVIDAIVTVEGGEGPWNTAITPIQPGLLIAGKDPVATDAVATTLMGFNPEIDYPNSPFVHAYNHLALAGSLGLGTNRLDRIDVVGESIAGAALSFRPAA